MSIGTYEKMVLLLVLQRLCIVLQISNGKLSNLVSFENCSMLLLKLEIIMQIAGPLLKFDRLFSAHEQEHATVSITYKTKLICKILWHSVLKLWSTSDLKFEFCHR